MVSSSENPILPEDQLKALIDAEIARLCDFRTRMSRRRRFVTTFTPIRKLGRGGEGDVSSMLHGPTNTVYAVKQLAQQRHDLAVPTAHNEVRILSLLMNAGGGDPGGPGLSTICQPAMDEAWFPSTPGADTQCIVLEYCELGSLHDYLVDSCFEDASPSGRTRAAWTAPHEGLLRHVYAQLLEGLAFLHCGYGTAAFDARGKAPVGRKPVVHRDIKPDNVLVCAAKPGLHSALVTVKISDFGGAAEVGDVPRTREDDDGLYFFTPGYIAPEFLKDGVSRSGANRASDVFAVGATMHFCVFGRPPFQRSKADGSKTVFRRRNMADLVHRGGDALSDDFVACVSDAVTYARHRKDALTILDKVRRNDAKHRREFLAWMQKVEEPRLEKERREAAERERREEEAREKEVREAMLAHLPLQCLDPECHDALLPHTHTCEVVQICYLGNIENHAHFLYKLYDTWADPRTHLAEDLRDVPLEDMKRALNLIELKTQAFQLLNTEKDVDELMRDVDALIADSPGPDAFPGW